MSGEVVSALGTLAGILGVGPTAADARSVTV